VGCSAAGPPGAPSVYSVPMRGPAPATGPSSSDQENPPIVRYCQPGGACALCATARDASHSSVMEVGARRVTAGGVPGPASLEALFFSVIIASPSRVAGTCERARRRPTPRTASTRGFLSGASDIRWQGGRGASLYLLTLIPIPTPNTCSIHLFARSSLLAKGSDLSSTLSPRGRRPSGSGWRRGGELEFAAGCFVR